MASRLDTIVYWTHCPLCNVRIDCKTMRERDLKKKLHMKTKHPNVEWSTKSTAETQSVSAQGPQQIPVDIKSSVNSEGKLATQLVVDVKANERSKKRKLRRKKATQKVNGLAVM